MKPKQTLALLQHQINWWSASGGVFKGGNFNVDHFEKVLKAKAKQKT